MTSTRDTCIPPLPTAVLFLTGKNVSIPTKLVQCPDPTETALYEILVIVIIINYRCGTLSLSLSPLVSPQSKHDSRARRVVGVVLVGDSTRS